MGGVVGVCLNPGAWTGGGDEVRIQIAWRKRHSLDAWIESADAPRARVLAGRTDPRGARQAARGGAPGAPIIV